jgi:hypothetical protein
MTESELLEGAMRSERALLSPEVRSRPESVGQLLAPEFFEIGQGGRRWERSEIVDEVSTGGGVLAEPTHMRATLVGAGLVLVTYDLVSGATTVRRTTLWRHSTDGLKAVFHQGTRVADGP